MVWIANSSLASKVYKKSETTVTADFLIIINTHKRSKIMLFKIKHKTNVWIFSKPQTDE